MREQDWERAIVSLWIAVVLICATAIWYVG